MNKKTVAPIAIVAVSLALFIRFRQYQTMVAQRFPDLDPKLARKAYRHMMALILRGEIGEDVENYTDEEMDVVFLRVYDSMFTVPM